MQGKKDVSPAKSFRKRASSPMYVSPNQLILLGFETPFEQQLTKNNRWVKLNSLISRSAGFAILRDVHLGNILSLWILHKPSPRNHKSLTNYFKIAASNSQKINPLI